MVIVYHYHHIDCFISDGKLLTENCDQLLVKVDSMLSYITQKVNDGNISVGNLRKVLSGKENILQLVEAAEINFAVQNKTNIAQLEKTFKVRAKELQECDHYLKQTELLMHFSKRVKAGICIMVHLWYH